MATYIRYPLKDGSSILIETEEQKGGVVPVSRAGNVIIEAQKQFKEALASVRGSISALLEELDALKVEEADVRFGLKAVGEADIFAVGKLGGEMNYEVTLKWKKAAANKVRSADASATS